MPGNVFESIFNFLYADLLQTKLLHAKQDRYTADGSGPWTVVQRSSINIIDVSLQPNQLANLVYRNDKAMTSDDIRNLPLQQSKTCRIYIAHGYETNESFKSHIQGIVSQPFDEFEKSDAPVKPTLLSNFQSNQSSEWNDQFYILKSTPSSSGIFPTTYECRLKIRTVWHRDGRMFCFVFCSTKFLNPYGGEELSSESQTVHRMLIEFSDLILSTNNAFQALSYPSDRILQHRITMLRICYALLDNHETHASEVANAQQTFKQRISNPARSIVAPEVLHIFLGDFHHWRTISNLRDTFTASLQSLLDAMQLRDDVQDQRSYQTLIIDLRSFCTRLHNSSTYITTLMDDTLRSIELGRSHRESQHVQMLSLLAIVYLPLSLASSLLSMQTRFFDLGALLVDFIGAAVLLISLTAFIYRILAGMRSSIRVLRVIVASKESVVPLVLLAIFYTVLWLGLLVGAISGMYI